MQSLGQQLPGTALSDQAPSGLGPAMELAKTTMAKTRQGPARGCTLNEDQRGAPSRLKRGGREGRPRPSPALLLAGPVVAERALCRGSGGSRSFLMAEPATLVGPLQVAKPSVFSAAFYIAALPPVFLSFDLFVVF